MKRDRSIVIGWKPVSLQTASSGRPFSITCRSTGFGSVGG